MPDIKSYDYQRHPDMPEGTNLVQWYFSPKKAISTLSPSAPWLDGPAMACFYNKDNDLILTRFINSDGTYKDAT